MPPEQIRGETPTPASDVYSLGILLFELLAGKTPFAAASPFSVAMMHVNAAPPDVRGVRSDVPTALGDVVMRCLAKAPGDRPSAPALRRDLEKLLADHRALAAVLEPLRTLVPGSGEASSGEVRSAWGVALFSDLVGFTPVAEAAAPRLVGHFLGEVFGATRRVVERGGGMVVQYIGDCCLSLFLAGDPHASVAAALAASEQLHREIDELAKKIEIDVRLRIGLNAGNMLVGPVSDGHSFSLLVVGETVNLASKVETFGQAGATCAAASLLPWLPDGFESALLREATYQGKPLAIYRIVRRGE